MKGERTKAALGVVTAIILVTTIGITSVTSIVLLQRAYAFTIPGIAHEKAPIAISGDNIYVTWSTNKTANNNEVMFRASTDNGATFGNKTNLSNTKGAESVDVQIAASGNNVYVSWWERNQTANEPVMRISDDNGESFGPVLHLASNGTISSGG